MKNKFLIGVILLVICLTPVYYCLADKPATAAAPAAGNTVTEIKLVNPLGGTDKNMAGDVQTVPQLIGKIIGAVLGVVGAITMLIFFRGANNWLFSAGNPEMIKKGMNAMLYAGIGVALILLSYILMSGVLKVASGGQ